MNFNKVIVLGYLTRDPESRMLPSGAPVCNFSIATNRVYSDKSGAKQQQTEFHNIVAFGKLADICGRYLAKGKIVLVEGKLDSEEEALLIERTMEEINRNFKGVEHRQEFVREVNGITYINNSKATTVKAVEVSLKSYDKPIVLIMGGKDKGNDYTTIYDLVKKKVRAIVATGYSADVIAKNFSTK